MSYSTSHSGVALQYHWTSFSSLASRFSFLLYDHWKVFLFLFSVESLSLHHPPLIYLVTSSLTLVDSSFFSYPGTSNSSTAHLDFLTISYEALYYSLYNASICLISWSVHMRLVATPDFAHLCNMIINRVIQIEFLTSNRCLRNMCLIMNECWLWYHLKLFFFFLL